VKSGLLVTIYSRNVVDSGNFCSTSNIYILVSRLFAMNGIFFQLGVLLYQESIEKVSVWIGPWLRCIGKIKNRSLFVYCVALVLLSDFMSWL
jgi:hypothetical protein